MQKIHLQHLRTLAKTHDYETFLCSLLAPKKVRAAIWTLCALDYELRRIPSVTQEETIRMIRFTWWREVLEEVIAEKPLRKHEVAEPLALLLQAHPELRGYVEEMLSARASWLFEEGDDAQCSAAKWAAIGAVLGAAEHGRFYGLLYGQQRLLRGGGTLDTVLHKKISEQLAEHITSVEMPSALCTLGYMLVNNQKRLLSWGNGMNPAVLQRPSLKSYAYIAYAAMRKNP